MILGCVIYLTYILHDKNIPEVISGQGHVMRLNHYGLDKWSTQGLAIPQMPHVWIVIWGIIQSISINFF